MKKLSILVVAGLLCLMALPAFAQDKADWAFYGSVRFWTSWEDWDKEAPTQTNFGAPGTKRSGNWVDGAGNRYDDSDLWWGMQYNARIGANVKWGNVAGRFEYGHLNTEGSGTGADTAHVRLLYGDWNFGPGVLRIGQDYTPFFYTISQQCGPSGGDCSGIGFGSLYSGRQDQIKLIFGGLQIALIEPKVVVPSSTVITSANDNDKIIPKIEASYNFNLGPANIFIAGGYNTFDAVYAIGGTEKEISVDSWGLGIGAKVPIGPFYVNAAFQYLVNPGNYGFGQNAPILLTTLDGSSDPNTSSSTEDLDVWTGALVLGFNLTSTMNFEAGVFMIDASTKTTGAFQGAPFGQDAEDTLWAYYIMMNWSPAKNVFISPEIGLIDFGKVKTDGRADDDLGDMFYVGIKWMINF